MARNCSSGLISKKTGSKILLGILLALFAVPGAHAALIAHYSFDGALTTDDSGNGHTLISGGGGPTQVGGQFGNAASFAGGSFFYNADAAFNLAAGNFAISLWYQAAQSSFSPLVGKNNSGTNQGYAVSQTGSLFGDLNDTREGPLRPSHRQMMRPHFIILYFKRLAPRWNYILMGFSQTQLAAHPALTPVMPLRLDPGISRALVGKAQVALRKK